MTCEDLDYDDYQTYNDKMTRNFKYGESWSSKRIAHITFKRRVRPDNIFFLDNVLKSANEAQKIRDKLGKPLHANSWWRTGEYQDYLYRSRQSTTDNSKHELGIAIDFKTPRGMTPRQFFDFIVNECNTKFRGFGIYYWGVHADMRKTPNNKIILFN